jgi:flagella basal body P-ring formation protein FlgA
VLRLIFFFLVVINSQVFASQETSVLVTTRNIKKGEVVNEADLVYEEMQLKSNKNYLSKIDLSNSVVRASRNLESGKPLRRNDLYVDSAVVHRGENVTVKFIKKNLSIEIPCVALNNGNVGDIIKVKSIDTNKILSGKVTEDGSILISNS